MHLRGVLVAISAERTIRQFTQLRCNVNSNNFTRTYKKYVAMFNIIKKLIIIVISRIMIVNNFILIELSLIIIQLIVTHEYTIN